MNRWDKHWIMFRNNHRSADNLIFPLEIWKCRQKRPRSWWSSVMAPLANIMKKHCFTTFSIAQFTNFLSIDLNQTSCFTCWNPKGIGTISLLFAEILKIETRLSILHFYRHLWVIISDVKKKNSWHHVNVNKLYAINIFICIILRLLDLQILCAKQLISLAFKCSGLHL